MQEFYYLCGNTIFFAIVGVLAASQMSGLQCCRGCDNIGYYPVFIDMNTADSCCFCCNSGSRAPIVAGGNVDCCGCCCRHGGPCVADASCCECGGGGCCSSCEGSGASGSLGHEAIICALIALAIFALIGVFVCIVLGLIYSNMLITRHIHVLRKLDLSKDYIVADLAPGASETDSIDNNNSLTAHELELAETTNKARTSRITNEGGVYTSLSTNDSIATAPSAPPLPQRDMITLRSLGLI